MIFRDTFIKSVKVSGFSAVVDLCIKTSLHGGFFSFLLRCYVFYIAFSSNLHFLFYSNRKVWIIPEILSPFPASYDKISFHLISKRTGKGLNISGMLHTFCFESINRTDYRLLNPLKSSKYIMRNPGFLYFS